MRRKIRFFNTFMPVNTFYQDLLPFLAEHEFDVEVFISGARYREGRTPLENQFASPNIQITFVSSQRTGLAGRWQKLRVMLAYVFGSMWRSFLQETDVNFFLTQPPLFFFWGWVIKKVRRQPYVCMVMDLYPDVVVRAGLLPEKSVVTRTLQCITKYTLRKADAVVVIGRCSACLLQKAGVKRERIQIITNWADERVIFPVDHNANPIRNKWGFTPEDFLVLYSGNMGISHDFDALIEVARQLQRRIDIKFVFVGDGSRRQQIQQAAQSFSNVFLYPFEPVQNLAHSLSAADVHFVSLRSGFEGLVVPSKTYGALAAGRPVVYQGNSCGEIARMIEEENIGLVVPSRDVAALKRAVITYVENPGLRSEQGMKAREVVLHKYSRQQALQKYLALFQEFSITHI